MTIEEIKDYSEYITIDVKTSDDEIISLSIFKNNDVIRINSGLNDHEMVVKPRTANEVDIKFV